MIFGLGAALLTIFAAGFGLTLLASRGRTVISLPVTCALAWLLGTNAISLLLWLGGMLMSGIVLQLSVTVSAVMLAGAGWLAAKRHRARFVWPAPRGLVEWVLGVMIALQCAAILYLCLSHGLGWDGLFNWEIKARYAFLNNGVMPASYYADASRFVTHPAYPLWIPLTELWLYLWMGEANQFWLKLLFPPFYVAGMILLVHVATQLTGRRWIGLLAAALFFFVPSLTNTVGGIQAGYVDVPISIVYLAAIGFLLVFAETNDPADFRFSAMALAVLPWTKQEGAVLWLVAAGCAAVVICRQRRWSALAWLVPGVSIIVGWKAFCAAMAMIPTHEHQLTLSTLRTNFPRLAVISRAFFAELFDIQHWSIFWPIVGLAFAWLFWRARTQRLYILVVAIMTPVAIYSGSFLFSGWPDWAVHMNVSISRLLLQVVPLTFLALALALQPPAGFSEIGFVDVEPDETRHSASLGGDGRVSDSDERVQHGLHACDTV
jgi:hypothetical protein